MGIGWVIGSVNESGWAGNWEGENVCEWLGGGMSGCGLMEKRMSD
jgi:hypothetical protein